MMATLLTRDQFREAVFTRDRHTCVYCKQPGQDAHHILERRLWSDGGYYLENGATLCGPCHIKAEETKIECDWIRDAAGIKNVVTPAHFYPDQSYDKWGNPYVTDYAGIRVRVFGELMDDESVRKVLAWAIDDPMLFQRRVKYPRTWHLPWSLGATSDDRKLTEVPWQPGENVFVSIKMDGENTTMYRDYLHARSIDGEHRTDQSYIRNLHATIAHEIPEGWRICGENLYATHSLKYSKLPSYFLVFGIWNGLTCLSIRDTLEWCDLLGLQFVPDIHWGSAPNDPVQFHRNIMEMMHSRGAGNPQDVVTGVKESEGYVVRPTGAFHMREYAYRVGKYVRASHVNTHGHWTRRMIEVNGLA